MRIVSSEKAQKLAQRDRAVSVLERVDWRFADLERRVAWLELPWWRRWLRRRPGRRG